MLRVLTTELMPREVMETVFELAEQTVEVSAFPLAETEQADTLLMLNAVVKARVRSKLVEEGEMAVSYMLNWALVALAVLGVTVAEVTEKLTCPSAVRSRASVRTVVRIGFISFEL